MSTRADKLDAIEREIRYRERVYPRLIAKGALTAGFAAAQIAIMKEIAADYRDPGLLDHIDA